MRKELFRFMIFCALVAAFGINRSAAQRLNQKNKVPIDTLRDTLVVIDNIHIIGNKKTKRTIITRELNFHEGDSIYSSQLGPMLEASKNNVYNTQLFSTVKLTKLPTDSGHVDILIDLVERWYFFPSAVFRLYDSNFNEWWFDRDRDPKRIQYGAKLEQYNFRGRKEKLKLVAIFGFKKWYLLEYSIPYINKSQKHGLAFGVAYEDNNNVAYQTVDHEPEFIETDSRKRGVFTGTVGYTYRPSFYNYHYVNLSGYHATIADTLAELNPNYFGGEALTQSALKLRYAFYRDLRDNRNYPLKGYMAFAEVEKTGLGIFNDVDLWRITANYNHYFDLGNHYYFSTSLSGQLSTVRDVPYYNYNVTVPGAYYYLRGYETKSIEGPHNILSKNTFKKRLFHHVQDISRVMPIEKFHKIPFAFYGKIFFDGGWVRNYPDYYMSNDLADRLLYGVGVGLDIVTLYDMTFRLEYSYNAANQYNLFLNFSAEL